MLLSSLLVIGGLALLFIGGEALLRGSVAIAHRFGISKLLTGLLIVGFGTSMPEMLVSVQAALGGVPELALGNVVGSNIANVLLIIGVAAVIAPIANRDPEAKFSAVIATAAAVILLIFCLLDYLTAVPGQLPPPDHLAPLLGYLAPTLGFIEGVVLLALLSVYFIVSYRRTTPPPETDSSDFFEGDSPETDSSDFFDGDALDAIIHRSRWLAPITTIVGIIVLVIGAHLLITGATDIARNFGVSDVIIGLSLVAFATSLPELATAIVASIKRESDVLLGGILGSNIFNILAILGVTLMLETIPVAAHIISQDIPLVIASSLALLALVVFFRRIGRGVGGAMLVLYGGYIVMLFFAGH